MLTDRLPRDKNTVARLLAADRAVPKQHRPETIADRLAYLDRDGGTEHLVERAGDGYALTDAGRALFC